MEQNEILRLINFIENAYFNKILLVTSMATKPENIYTGKMSAIWVRSISRIYEMDSSEYIKQYHTHFCN